MIDMIVSGWEWLLPEGEVFASFNKFMSQGGIVLWCLFSIMALFWLLVVERIYYLFAIFPSTIQIIQSRWRERDERSSWYANAIRMGWLSHANQELSQNLALIKLLVTMFPMLGLLGTVTGMISVFDIMAIQGNGDPRLMASGIALATLPTMAGMVAALVGVFTHARLQKTCQRKMQTLEKILGGSGEIR